jgi:hypothetical protein
MTWTPITQEQVKQAQAVVLWIETARQAGRVRTAAAFGGYLPGWLPSIADIHKSALYERIRSGKAPLPFPPPLGLACPWYAAVEDPTPHYLGRRAAVAHEMGGPSMVICDWSQWLVVSTGADTEAPAWIVADWRHRTPYRWRLWTVNHPEVGQHHPGPAVYLQRIEDAP